MKRCVVIRMGVWCAAMAVLPLASCGASSSLSIDDAYHWDDTRAKATTTETNRTDTQTASEPAAASGTVAPAPSIEYISVRDTTVTVRVKK